MGTQAFAAWQARAGFCADKEMLHALMQKFLVCATALVRKPFECFADTACHQEYSD